MATTLLKGYPQSSGSKIESVVQVDGLASYTTGGQTIEATACGMKYVEYIGGGVDNAGTNFTIGKVDTKVGATSGKLLWYVGTTGAEVANTTNLSTLHANILVKGF